MHTSCFMDIQQQENESLAAYFHWFRTEAKHCSFMNDAATIRIFIKGLRDAHHLAARIYKKDTHINGHSHRSRESQCKTTTYCDNHFIINGQHDAKQVRLMLPMPRTRTHHMTLPPHHLSWMWWIQTHHHGLPSQNNPFRDTGARPQGT